jgi:hypothetical protein
MRTLYSVIALIFLVALGVGSFSRELSELGLDGFDLGSLFPGGVGSALFALTIIGGGLFLFGRKGKNKND